MLNELKWTHKIHCEIVCVANTPLLYSHHFIDLVPFFCVYTLWILTIDTWALLFFISSIYMRSSFTRVYNFDPRKARMLYIQPAKQTIFTVSYEIFNRKWRDTSQMDFIGNTCVSRAEPSRRGTQGLAYRREIGSKSHVCMGCNTEQLRAIITPE